MELSLLLGGWKQLVFKELGVDLLLKEVDKGRARAGKKLSAFSVSWTVKSMSSEKSKEGGEKSV